jgi:hypothetical protein
MCYEFEREYLRQRAEEARRATEDERKRRQESPAPAKPERDKAPVHPDAVPV